MGGGRRRKAPPPEADGKTGMADQQGATPDRRITVSPRRDSRLRERSLALFLLGLVAFTPPLMMVFDHAGTLFGLPALYVYLFAVWATLIALAWRITSWRRRTRREG